MNAMRLVPTLLLAAAASACGSDVPSNSACRNLPYTDGGVSREVYLPCAGEMMAALDRLAGQTDAVLRGDSDARSEGQAQLRRLLALMAVAGGRQLLERWDDRTLTDLNVDINNCVTHYQAFYMLRVLDESHPYAAKSREAAGNEARAARLRYEEARRLYRRLSPSRSVRSDAAWLAMAGRYPASAPADALTPLEPMARARANPSTEKING
jgi:hypothetical protein